MTELPPAFVVGDGAVDRLGELARDLGSRALLVTDPGIVRAGHVDRGRRALESAGIDVSVFDAVHENPTTEDVDRCLAAARAAEIDLFVGLGGGSSIDTAKGANFLLSNGGVMQDYWGVGKASEPLLPLIAVPTTAGTGTEGQSYALIVDPESHRKMACGDPKALPAVAILDATLTVTQPRLVTACTGMDAVTHAVESAVSSKQSDASRAHSREAFRRAAVNLPRVLSNPTDVEARGEMLLAAAHAGCAIENGMLGAAHSMANPLTARYDVAHGQAVGMMLPHVVRYNAEVEGARDVYVELARLAGFAAEDAGPEAAVEALIRAVGGLLAACELPPTLAGCGVTEDAIPALAAGAAEQWTAQFNPRPVGAEDFEGLYRAALGRA